MPFNSKCFTAHLTKGGVNIMLIIPIKEGENIDRALKQKKV
jgi:small subunit ribosomal protein S21